MGSAPGVSCRAPARRVGVAGVAGCRGVRGALASASVCVRCLLCIWRSAGVVTVELPSDGCPMLEPVIESGGGPWRGLPPGVRFVFPGILCGSRSLILSVVVEGATAFAGRPYVNSCRGAPCDAERFVPRSEWISWLWIPVRPRLVGLVSRLYTNLGAASEGWSSWAHNRLNRGSAGGILARDVVLAPGRECGARQWTGELVECGVVYIYAPAWSARLDFPVPGLLTHTVELAECDATDKVAGAHEYLISTLLLIVTCVCE